MHLSKSNLVLLLYKKRKKLNIFGLSYIAAGINKSYDRKSDINI